MSMFVSECDEEIPIPGKQYQAWAIWNNCQGVFTCSVRHRRSECVDLLKDGEYAGCKIVPVTVVVDAPSDWWLRHYQAEQNN